ncbi:tripartite tricarboxylate transporter substrate binding protein [Ramlibacter sp. G-1-2-2]|uniref:Tripartite tricarboxylate transporter substrate binding protein n=1 Tax=Ramlibacter agri TaxID=2728837 RepID=A0A848HBY7_9BURK|nr:tripartite tricarboxylate transporter substrate binding protein [Ramlibacter agri]NML47602.1 tripartite tricarboxylate transporter substrate binding protein [Ramlibacter agri]
MKRLLCAWMALACTCFATQAGAQDFPRQAIKLIVPFAAGGPADTQARWVATKLAAALGQPVVVDDRGGAGGIVGTQAVVNAAPDGYTLLFSSVGAIAIAPYLMSKVPYDPATALAPVIRVATAPTVLVTSANSKYPDLAALVADAKARPGKVSFASAGPGTTTQLGSELLKREAGIDMVHIPYKGAAPAITDVIAGTVDVMFADAPVVLPFVKSGKLRALTIGTPKRASALPDVPTTAEAGHTGVLVSTWYGVLAPAKTPPAVVKRLNTALNNILSSPDAVAFFGSQSVDINGGSPEEFGSFIASEAKRWTALARDAGVKMD